ncbi:MAG: hypothetical protein ACRDOO_24795 [Actinomadura sp.]
MSTRGFTLVVALSVVLALTAACGSEDTRDGVASAGGGAGGASASPSQSLDPEEARLKFAQCMRENGVDMPDPDGSGRVAIKGRPGDQGKLQDAMKKCEHFMQGAIAKRLEDPKVRDQMLKFARCMREHGIDMPDPRPGEGVQLRVQNGDRAKVEAAQKACGELRPGGGSRTTSGGGG